MEIEFTFFIYDSVNISSDRGERFRNVNIEGMSPTMLGLSVPVRSHESNILVRCDLFRRIKERLINGSLPVATGGIVENGVRRLSPR